MEIIDDYWKDFNDLMQRFGLVYPSEPSYQMAIKYIKGLLGPVARKNGWQLSEYIGATTPYALQQFLYRGRFSADALRDILRDYIAQKIGDEDGVLVVDETGFLKQGKKSCGVKRQYSGTAGRIENCQIGVFLTYASYKGSSPIDRRLYIPQEWLNDTVRRKEAGIPEQVTFKTKPQMGLEMIKEATEAGFPYKWVTGDCVYGDYREIRQWLEANRKSYCMSVSGKEYVWQGYRQHSVGSILKKLEEGGWIEGSCGEGSKGERVYEWQRVEINGPMIEGWKRVMLVRRNKSKPDKIRAYICCAEEETPTEKLIEVIGKRWTVETCFKESKKEVGLEEYEVRSYGGWYKHITLSLIALGFLTVVAGKTGDKKALQEHEGKKGSLEEFKRGRKLGV